MTRLIVLGLLLAGFATTLVGCTNTVRGFGKDVDSDHIQNYNSRTADVNY